MKTTIVSLFDDSRALEKAVNELNSRGFEERVFDRASVSQEVGHGVSPLTTPGAGPTPGGAGLAHGYPEDSSEEVSRTFRSHLSNLRLSDAEIEGYVNNFNHEAKFVIVTTERHRAADAMEILRRADASRVDQH